MSNQQDRQQELSNQLNNFCKKHNYPLLSADELMHHIVQRHKRYKSIISKANVIIDTCNEHVKWLDNFLAQWEDTYGPTDAEKEEIKKIFTKLDEISAKYDIAVPDLYCEYM
jgi:predicted RNA-binding protein with EMAP domain